MIFLWRSDTAIELHLTRRSKNSSDIFRLAYGQILSAETKRNRIKCPNPQSRKVGRGIICSHDQSLLMNKQFFVDLVTFLLVFLFVYAAVSKLIDFQQFQIQLLKSPLLHVIAVPVSVLTPIAEILIAVMLCFGSMKLIGLYASFSIMLIFTF